MANEYITMHGASFDGSGAMTETQVHVDNIQAFKNAGWKEGALPQKEKHNETEGKAENETEEVATVKIVNESGDGFIEIPESDFDKKSMNLWDDTLEVVKFIPKTRTVRKK